MLLDISSALRHPGEEFSFDHAENIPDQQIAAETVTFDAPARLTGTFVLSGGKLRLKGRLSATARAQCANCLEAAAYELDVPFDEIFLREQDLPPARDQLDEDDRLVFSGPQVDLAPLTLTLALLELPMRFLCRPDCPGLIGQQEHLTTQATAAEDNGEANRPFSALKHLLTKDEEV